jgi:hypothetical protein
MNFDNYLFRCSGLSKLMTEPKLKVDKEAGNLAQTTTNYLKEIYREAKYSRRNEFSSKYIEKGLSQEENAITLFSRVTKTFYKKNDTRLNNKFITGEPDLFAGDEITKCKEGFDIKCSWSIFTFPFPDDVLDPCYKWQNAGYMYLTGAEKWTTAYCLVNATANLVLNEKKAIWYKLGCPDEEDEQYIEKCIEVEKNMIFNRSEFIKVDPGFDFHCRDWQFDIPLKERVLTFTTERNEDDIKIIQDKVLKARKWLNDLTPSQVLQLQSA